MAKPVNKDNISNLSINEIMFVEIGNPAQQLNAL